MIIEADSAAVGAAARDEEEEDEGEDIKADQKQLSDQKKSESKKGIPNSALSNSKANEEAVRIAQTNSQRDAARCASVASAYVSRTDAVPLRNRVAQQQTEAKLRASAVQKVDQIRAKLERSLKVYNPQVQLRRTASNTVQSKMDTKNIVYTVYVLQYAMRNKWVIIGIALIFCGGV
jgi:hypothetical protein